MCISQIRSNCDIFWVLIPKKLVNFTKLTSRDLTANFYEQDINKTQPVDFRPIVYALIKVIFVDVMHANTGPDWDPYKGTAFDASGGYGIPLSKTGSSGPPREI